MIDEAARLRASNERLHHQVDKLRLDLKIANRRIRELQAQLNHSAPDTDIMGQLARRIEYKKSGTV